MENPRPKDEKGPCPAYRSKYSDWTDAKAMLEHRQHGLLRYRIKQNDDIKFTTYTALSMFDYGHIDVDTFKAVYNKYQSFFNHKNILNNAIKSEVQDKQVIGILLEQTRPMIFYRDVSRLIDLCESGSYELLKYLLDSGHYYHVQWKWSQINMEKLFKKISASSIQYLLNPDNNFPQSLTDRIKRSSSQYVTEILAKGDQQLIDQLLFKDGVKLFNGPITDRLMLPITASPTQQLERFERLLPLDDTLNDQAISRISMSKSIALKLTDELHYTRQDTDIGDEQRMIFVKLGELEKSMVASRTRPLDRYMVHEYIVTGDCMLLPYLIIHPKRSYHKHEVQNIVNEIIKHGNLTQLIVAIGLLDNELIPKHKRRDAPLERLAYFGNMYNAFVDADNMTKSLECIKYLNQHDVVQGIVPQIERKQITLLRTPPMFVLAFLMSTDNNIFPKELLREKLVLMEPQQIDFVLNNMPSFFNRYAGVCLNELDFIVYTHYAILNNNQRGKDIFSTLLYYVGWRTKALEPTIHYFTSHGRMNMEAVHFILDQLHLAPSEELTAKIGIEGVVRMFRLFKFDHLLENSINDLSIMFNIAIVFNEHDLAKHIYKYQKGMIDAYTLQTNSSYIDYWNNE
ncbi:hypothetical protein SAMD00019534_023600 [Acytostelium subglobosum LB1]|uniref:hypothetical protein n=1 Tax=Acytostelium subglobosum LB1 TaxID=1410327 RepID=UPI0006450B78|nr:hypothetical protein SAMD00019534_023600 [Acytostelium subglobosum LB1]GAM19185.1 hypothetical protein SAMD00019534_023600 [Acytostelium subglobosum LB1]|eukprot:XP_012757112.1 hypothetical protein SAMD00019534_023600 [Acytostelium subglobosum LB1]